MTTLKDYRREMVRRAGADGQSVGRLVTPASIAAQTVTVNALAFGSAPASRYATQWMVRADSATAAAADRVRLISGYQSESGVLAHTGTAYADTTATGETIEILPFEPYLYDLAINETLGRLKRLDRTTIPCRNAIRKYWIGDMDWITGPGDIVAIAAVPNPVISRNRYFEKWNGVDTSGDLMPDWWTLSGTGATMARSTTGNRRGTYTCAVTYGSATATLTQSPGLLDTGYAAETLRGRTVTALAVIQTATASQARVNLTDGVSTVHSSYHSGGGTLEELTVVLDVDSDATELTLTVTVEAAGTAYIEECLVSQLVDNTVRRDSYPERFLAENDYGFDQGTGTPALILPEQGLMSQYAVYSQRAYPQFDATRLQAGTADADVSDAPLAPVAAGALGRLFEGLAQQGGVDTTRFTAIAQMWNKRYEKLALALMWAPNNRGTGMALPIPVPMNQARRA